MRPFERTCRRILKGKPVRNKVHLWIRKWIVLAPLMFTDFSYVIIKTEGHIENDPWWDELTDMLFCAGYTKTVKDLFEMTSGFQECFKKEA